MLDDFAAHCLELFAPLGSARARRMFGGHGLYVDELFVAIIAAERLYLKADNPTRARFEAAGCTPFSYQTHDGRQTVMSYYSAPEDALDAPHAMLPWARLAQAAALRAHARKAASQQRAASRT